MVVSIEEIENYVNLLLDELKDAKDALENQFNKLQIALSSSLRLLDGSETKTLSALHGNPENLKTYLISIVSGMKDDTANRFLSMEQHTKNISQLLSNLNRKH